jgi:hypothetical protein
MITLSKPLLQQVKNSLMSSFYTILQSAKLTHFLERATKLPLFFNIFKNRGIIFKFKEREYP